MGGKSAGGDAADRLVVLETRDHVAKTDDRESLGVVSLAGDTLWAPGEFGLVEYPLSSAIEAWRI